MKSLHFRFMNAGEVLYDVTCEFTMQGEYICFEHAGMTYKIKLENGIEFWRSTLEDEFVIREDATSTITLKNLNRSFAIPVETFECKKRGNKCSIKYELASDVGKVKTIILTFRD